MARVLIVQGHARSRADTAATLRAEGHEVLEAGSADNGVRLTHDQGPEVILLDRGEAALARAKRAGRNRCEIA
jgi:PleD family two-component response regulator